MRLHDPFPQIIRMLRAAPVVDIEAVWHVMDNVHLSAQLCKRNRSNLIGGAVGDVQDYFHLLHREIAGKGILQKYDVPAVHIFHAERLSHLAGRRQEIFKLSAKNEVFYGFFLLIGQLETVAVEYLDSIVLVWVMGGRDHDAGIRPHALRNIGDPRRGQDADQVEDDRPSR